MIILLDAMGGDNAPDANIKGAVAAVNQVDAEIWLIGKEDVIKNKLKEFYNKTAEEISPKLKIYHAPDTIEMEDIPTVAIKRKKESSMVVGFNLLKEGKGDVFISAGNSGALLTGATLLVGRIKGIDRPAIAGILPSYHKRLVLMDCGSNTNCKPINLLQFAQMSNIYIHDALGVEHPAIGLLNIGTEETKGNELIKESYQLLKEKSEELGINFIGNIEGRDAFSGKVDAIIADGFTGNIFLKTVEGMGKFIKKSLNESIKKNVFSIIGALPTEDGDAQVVSLGISYLHLISWMYILPGMTNGIQGFFRGIGDLKVTLYSTFMNMLGRVVAVFVMLRLLHMDFASLAWANMIGWIVMLLFEIPLLVKSLRSGECR